MTAGTSTLTSALEEYREVLQIDGADLELTGVDAGIVHLRLIVGPDTCTDCILSKPMLETILLDVLQEADPAVTLVVVDDPRSAL
ncbi:MAG: NifU family protein [Actinobacteria bacterium]|uniref:Unannotated protein n=1 Tax=freshwater metagenome TaxID=449393 RepID=A0A6J7C3N3_9ZZZZ|nr:NifU family protein [Actinomycetota bacterium]MSX38972.1 NifU family protein [Actinomycetota bacterium]